MFCSNSEGDYYRIVSTQKVLSEVSGGVADIEKVYLHYLGVKVALKYLLFALRWSRTTYWYIRRSKDYCLLEIQIRTEASLVWGHCLTFEY